MIELDEIKLKKYATTLSESCLGVPCERPRCLEDAVREKGDKDTEKRSERDKCEIKIH